ncbi:DNA-3-methyladenine glycosylase family protein [Marinicella sp. W31]|uniref:DNA-3-methyladenine glycosylase family protein n=1 Tax=Marinicella sp. W31 TaxID=3023713 RepID=UPI003756E971
MDQSCHIRGTVIEKVDWQARRQQGLCEALKPGDSLLPYIQQVGAYLPDTLIEYSLFGAVSRIIVYQQLSTQVARSIHTKFCALFEMHVADPVAAMDMSIEQLRSAGLSQSKARSIQHLAEMIQSGDVPNEQVVQSLSELEIVECLTQVRGVGPWTANIALMSWLMKPDIMPAADLGLRKGLQKIDGLDALPNEAELLKRAEDWRPYRSVASWYLWRCLELPS